MLPLEQEESLIIKIVNHLTLNIESCQVLDVISKFPQMIT